MSRGKAGQGEGHEEEPMGGDLSEDVTIEQGPEEPESRT